METRLQTLQFALAGALHAAEHGQLRRQHVFAPTTFTFAMASSRGEVYLRQHAGALLVRMGNDAAAGEVLSASALVVEARVALLFRKVSHRKRQVEHGTARNSKRHPFETQTLTASPPRQVAVNKAYRLLQ